MTGAMSVTGVSRDREAGFSLVELLVALSLLSLVSLALFASLRFGILAWGRDAEHTKKMEQIAFSQSFLRRLIADAYPFFMVDGSNRGQITFDGTSVSLRILASSPIALGGAGRSWFTLSLDEHDHKTDLILLSQPELADREVSSTLLKKVLISDVKRLELSFFGKSRSEKLPQWRGQWTGEAMLPELVRIRIEFPVGDVRSWPELLVSPRIAVDVGCIYDTLTKQCRGR